MVKFFTTHRCASRIRQSGASDVRKRLARDELRLVTRRCSGLLSLNHLNPQYYSHIRRYLQVSVGIEADDLVSPKPCREIPWVRMRFAASIGCARLLRQRPYDIRCTCRPFRPRSNPKRALRHSPLSNSSPQTSATRERTCCEGSPVTAVLMFLVY
jgi:hypothetical protein